ncbi:O6-methylguanine-DNA--protein-cysteine methyltransferase [Paenibacillus forsythiae]|uniref:O6-methylguanine-DNA--protein-cysteine methyltransferase n=1 Tax=Paenibacillus forsythiae TaxID=365616 RepID=A0ABU3H5T7_9BACL|nr:DUF3600 domain-containing protein [Paenibacillus forsythiae]MDT3426179.1 O6-methylguanine-DNA--protein-cysteine methyltransferase [Paenibacillus forsythiae]
MKLEEELREALREESRGWTAPPELKDRILNHQSLRPEGRRMKKWIAVGILAAVLLVPTGAYAGYHYLADSVYGSQERLEQFGGTQQQYDHLEKKLQAAKQSLNPQEFAKLMGLLKKLGDYNLKIADDKGALHPERLSPEEQEAYKKLNAELEPYFEKLNAEGAGNGGVKENGQQADDAWKEVLAHAEQNLSSADLAKVKGIIGEIQKLQAQASRSDGSVRAFTNEEKEQLKELIRQLEPYQSQLGIMLKPVK